MTASKYISLIGALLAVSACHNEPFDIKPLIISQVETTAATASYIYHNQKISSFIRATSTRRDTSKFYYAGDVLTRVVTDSTAESYQVIRITGSRREPQFDSLFVVTPLSTTLLEARRFSFDTN